MLNSIHVALLFVSLVFAKPMFSCQKDGINYHFRFDMQRNLILLESGERKWKFVYVRRRIVDPTEFPYKLTVQSHITAYLHWKTLKEMLTHIFSCCHRSGLFSHTLSRFLSLTLSFISFVCLIPFQSKLIFFYIPNEIS